MILFSKYKGTIFYILPMPFIAMGKCELCDSPILLCGISLGTYVLTMQIHFHN